MSNSKTYGVLLAVAFVSMMLISPMASRVDAITCDDVNNDLLPCLSYLSGGGQVPADCCSGLKTLVKSAKTKNDRQTACTCLKSLATDASDSEFQRAAGLPKLCGANVPFKISRNIDCSRVN